MLVAQACEFHKRYPYGMPPPDRFKNPVVDDALLEATLVHLRLLDDFLRSTGGPRSVRAQEWVSQHDWQPRKDWLKPEIRTRISQQVAHLSQQRVLPEPAPARMQTGPRTASAARRCSAFSPSSTIGPH